jgi:hypothetical protein
VLTSVIGRWSALALFVIGVAYVIALAIGFATVGLSKPIVDPLLAVMEALTLASAPLLVLLMSAIHQRVPSHRRIFSTIALAFMVLMAGLTSAVHFVELTALRQLGRAGLVWPSPAYALELLAWDLFLGLSLIFGAFAFDMTSRERHLRQTFVVCGVLCLLGLIGPLVGNMRWQLIGVLGYGGMLPLIALLLCQFFRTEQASAP